MGKLIEQIAQAQGHQIVAKFTHEVGPLNEADVCLDFSHHSSVIRHIQQCASAGKPIVIGTTGWEKQLEQAKNLVEQSKIGCLYAPNFSIGVHLFLQIVSYAAQIVAPFAEYDVGGVEYHHRHKVDSPSGTAKALTKRLLEHISPPSSFQFASVRCGFNPGMHSVEFDSPFDTITLTHSARNREGMVYGVLRAADWIRNKTGFFTLEDLLQCP